MALSRIDALLLYCLRVVPDTMGAGGLEAPSSSDWENLLEASGQHGVAPLLYHRLKTVHSDIPIPANVMERLRQAYLENAARNMGLHHQLGKLLKLFRQKNISVIALKGAHLATIVYRNIALRPMGDIDLLVKQSDLLRVQEILVEQGYNASTEDTGCAQEHLPPYYKKGSFPVEIHFHIVGPLFSLRIDVEKLFARTHMGSIQGVEVLTLCPEDLLLHLCMHVSLHHIFGNGIRPLFDISQTVEHYAETLDWEQLLDRSKEWGVSRCVSLSFFFAKKFAGAPIPGQISKELAVYHDGFPPPEHAEELLFRKATPMEPTVAKLFNGDSLHNRLAHAIRCAFPPKKTMANMQPQGRKPLSVYFLYFFRIKGLLKRHHQTIWRLLLRDRELSTFAILENKRNTLKDWLTRSELDRKQ